MSIYFDVYLDGGVIGYKLAHDPEEATEALLALARWAPTDFGEELTDHMVSEHHAPLAQFLRRLADQIHAPEPATAI